MGKIEQVVVPDIGDFDAVDVIEVLVVGGDEIEVEASLITLESEKATMDVPSPFAGTVREVKVKQGDQVKAGDLVLILEVTEADSSANDSAAGDEAAAGPEAKEAVSGPEPEAAGSPTDTAAADSSASVATQPAGQAVDEETFQRAYASPAVRRFARELGVDLGRVPGTGRKGRILKGDVQGFVKSALQGAGPGSGPRLPEMPVIDFSKFGEIERRPLSRIKKISGPYLRRSWLHVPHVTQNDEADVTEMEAFRKAHSEEAKARGIKLTPLAFLMKACVAALVEYPEVNASLDPDGEHLIYKRYYHFGIAVDTPEGLMVPVVRDVDQKGVFELAEELGVVSEQTREGKLPLDRLRGASFTISSLGGIGGGHFTPIVNAPEVAILGVGRSRTEAIWNGNEFEPRLILPLSLSYDHRVVDGALGVRFTSYLTRVLSDIRRLVL